MEGVRGGGSQGGGRGRSKHKSDSNTVGARKQEAGALEGSSSVPSGPWDGFAEVTSIGT